MKIGENIKKRRAEYQVTQEWIAEKLSVSPQAVSKWENNTALPDITLVPAIAGLLRMTTDELLGFDSEQQERDKITRELLLLYWFKSVKNIRAINLDGVFEAFHECNTASELGAFRETEHFKKITDSFLITQRVDSWVNRSDIVFNAIPGGTCMGGQKNFGEKCVDASLRDWTIVPMRACPDESTLDFSLDNPEKGDLKDYQGKPYIPFHKLINETIHTYLLAQKVGVDKVTKSKNANQPLIFVWNDDRDFDEVLAYEVYEEA